MDDLRNKLIDCFCTVFPELTSEQVLGIDSQNHGDSLSWITLLAVIQEEFGTMLDIDITDIPVGFDALLERISSTVPSAGTIKP